ncbi:hypothetical protein CFK37_19020 [Virgibacillus phasianinus]|uniref:DUF2207 domain-containing protein n=1 Tax=Virgibacillus phasianinus TaxID=2017483 RepID=A0A220U878_9BACI|nr:hypothetical protein CFK37_19020 [Virgibacillus phasianinus]
MKSIIEFILSVVLILGWFILIAGIIGFIISLIAKGMFIVVPSSAIAIGLLCIWFYKKLS